MGTNIIAILLGIATIVILVAHSVLQKKRNEQFRQELIDKYGGKE